MAFLPPVVGCLLTKKAYKRAVTGTPGSPLATPLPTGGEKKKSLL